jgi:chromosome segregation ATPase
MAGSRAKLTSSVRRSIIALNQYLSELTQESLVLGEEYAHYQRTVDTLRKREQMHRPLAEQMARPIGELNTRTRLNLREIRELKHQNCALKSEIAEMEMVLAVPLTSPAEGEERADHLLNVLQDYEILFTEMTVPPPLPYPHVCRDEMAWMIANWEKPELPPDYLRSCRRMAEISDDFHSLPFEQKRQFMEILKNLREHCLEICHEIKQIDTEVQDQHHHEFQIRKLLTQYAAVSQSMQKVKFGCRHVRMLPDRAA